MTEDEKNDEELLNIIREEEFEKKLGDTHSQYDEDK